jgi:hypothetical protein
MEYLHGTIRQNGKVLLENIAVWLTVIEPPLGLKEWRGNFKASPGKIEINREYELALEDGRSGKILIKNLQISNSGPTLVQFVGTGPLG